VVLLALSVIGTPGVALAQGLGPSHPAKVSKPFVLICEPGGECASVAYFEAQATSPSADITLKVFGPEQSPTEEVDGAKVVGAVGDCILAGVAAGTLVFVTAEDLGASGVVGLLAPSLTDQMISEFSYSCEASLVADAFHAAVHAVVSFVGWIRRQFAEPPGSVGAGSEVSVHAG
jgi:hypothetical protein